MMEHFQDVFDMIPAHAEVQEVLDPGGSWYSKEGTNYHALVSRWDSWDEFVEFIEKSPFCPSIRGNQRNAESHNQNYPSYNDQNSLWYGPENQTLQECMALCKTGWRNGAESIRRLMDPVVDKISGLIERENFLFQTEGVDFDVANVLTGEPEHWLQPYTVFVQGQGRRIYTLQVNTTANCNITSKQIIWRGSAICALANALEIAGFGVEIYAYDVTNRNKLACVIENKIKGADEPMDLPKIAFALAHPGKLRRMMFKYFEIFSSLKDHFWAYEPPWTCPMSLGPRTGSTCPIHRRPWKPLTLRQMQWLSSWSSFGFKVWS